MDAFARLDIASNIIGGVSLSVAQEREGNPKE
jgi:hypothetical protein